MTIQIKLRRSDVCNECRRALEFKVNQLAGGVDSVSIFCNNFRCFSYGLEKSFTRDTKKDRRKDV